MEILHYIGLYLLALMGALLLGVVSAIFVVGTHWLIMKALRREPGHFFPVLQLAAVAGLLLIGIGYLQDSRGLMAIGLLLAGWIAGINAFVMIWIPLVIIKKLVQWVSPRRRSET